MEEGCGCGCPRERRRFSAFLLQPVRELGKLHLDPFDIRTELFQVRMDGLNLNGYVAGFFGEVFQICLFQTSE